MDNPRRAAAAAIALVSLFGLNPAGMVVAAQPAAAPDSVTLTITDIEISQTDNKQDFHPIAVTSPLNTLTTTSSPPPTIGTSEPIPVGDYRVLKLTIGGGTWGVNWTVSNRSPCTSVASGAENGQINFGGNSDFYFKTADLGGNTGAYYLAHPPVKGYVGDTLHPFLLPSPITVVKDGTTTVNLTIDVDDVLTCNSVSVYNGSAGGNTPPTRALAGPGTALTGVAGIVLNSYADEIAVSNHGDDSVTFYDRMASDDMPPSRTLIGPATLFNQPTGVALLVNQADHAQDALYVANHGNNSISVFTWASSGNQTPKRTLAGSATKLSGPAGLATDADNNEIAVANDGNDSVTFYTLTAAQNAPPLRVLAGSNTGLHQPSGIALRPDPLNPSDLSIVVANQGNNSVTVYDRNSLVTARGQLIGGVPADTSVTKGTGLILALNGDSNRTIVFGATVTDGASVALQIQLLVRALSSKVPKSLQSAYANFTASYTGPSGGYVLTSGAPGSPSSVVVADGSTADALCLTSKSCQGGPGAVEVDGSNLSPSAVLIGGNTQLNTPAGVAVYVDPVSSENDRLLVANHGSGTITVYDWNDVIAGTNGGNLAPMTTLSDLNAPTGLYLDTVHNEIGVTQGGDQVAMAFQPSVMPTSTNATASGSVLTGDYHVVVYGVDLDSVNSSGLVNPLVVTERGDVAFTPSASPWPTMSLIVDTELGRQVLQPNCLQNPDVGVLQTGYYDVNTNGTFYAVFPGTGGTIQGAYLPDGSIFVGSIVDSSHHLQIIYGVRSAGTGQPYLTSDGTFIGQPAYYGYANYRNDLWSLGRLLTPPSSDVLRYMLGIGMAQTNASVFIDTSGDANFLEIVNPMGDAGAPKSGGPVYSKGFSVLNLAPNNQDYNNSSPGGGDIQNPTDGLTGSVTPNGATLVYMMDTTAEDDYQCPTDIGFGMGLRQQPAGTYTTASVKGTYYVSAFGDRYDSAGNTSQYRSSALGLTFDGKGHALLGEVDNQTGMIAVIQGSLTYQVHQKTIPLSGDTQYAVDVIDLYDRSKIPYASALIGSNAQTLLYYQNLTPVSANLIRQLGLAVFQHS
jgi:hypothetical protein